MMQAKFKYTNVKYNIKNKKVKVTTLKKKTPY